MIFVVDITTPQGTLISNPVTTLLKVAKGLVYKIEVEYPPGACGSHYVKILDGAHQVWPTTPNTYFHGDDEIISFEDMYIKNEPPYEFTIVTYNTGDSYDHLVQVRIGLVSSKVFMARFLPTYTYDKLVELLAQANEEQEAFRIKILAKPIPSLMP